MHEDEDEDDEDEVDTGMDMDMDMDMQAADRYRRRRLRLGALLFQLAYYMQDPADVAAGIYRRGADTYAQLSGETVRLVRGDGVETLTLEQAIARCKEALRGAPLHRSPPTGRL